MRALLLSTGLVLAGLGVQAETLTLAPVSIPEWKPVYGTIETRDSVPARARIGGTITELLVSEGDHVTAGQQIALVHDDKLALQIEGLDAQLSALAARLDTAQADLDRGNQLSQNGVITGQRLEGLQANVDVLKGEISGTEAQKLVVMRQIEEGAVLAPSTGVVLDVPVAQGSVINPGEPLAVVGGGGTYLRLSIPERHADALHEGDMIQIDGAEGPRDGRLVKLYPQIAGGRLQADVEVEGLDGTFVGRRVPVRLAVGSHDALVVPAGAVHSHGGVDFVSVAVGGHEIAKTVVPGALLILDGIEMREILTGLNAGDMVIADE